MVNTFLVSHERTDKMLFLSMADVELDELK